VQIGIYYFALNLSFIKSVRGVYMRNALDVMIGI
jgi:hypothetical protein